MAYRTLYLSLLVTLTVLLHGSQAVDYTVTNNAGSTVGGVRFNNEICATYSKQTLCSTTDFIWRIFQQTTAAERKPVQKVRLFIDNLGKEDVAYKEDNAIYLNANYIGNYTGDVKREVTGILYHEMTQIWQWKGNSEAPQGLIEGIADFVRLKANYAPSHWLQAGEGDRWDQGYDVTARFLDYCNSLRNGFVAELNKKMRSCYCSSYFVDLLGKTVDQLWSDYKAKYGKVMLSGERTR